MNQQSKNVGIDDIAIDIPNLYISAKEFAKARGVEPAKIIDGLGIEEMAIPDANQDPATMAANAALKLMRANDLKPQDIGRLDVPTESGLDESKALSSYVIGLLEQIYGPGSFRHCGGVEMKFACVSGSYALDGMINWIRADENYGKAAIVVTSDIAKYDMNTPGERTQGAGAVAMLIKEDPRLLAFEPRVFSKTVGNEHDFFRTFGKETPTVHGVYSNLAYLDYVKGAMEEYKTKALEQKHIILQPGECVLDHVDFVNVHIPFSMMGKKALAYLCRHEWRETPRWKKILEKVGMKEPFPGKYSGTIQAILKNEKFQEQDKIFQKKFMETPEFTSEFMQKMESSLRASRHIGNIYSGSLYLGFRSCMEEESRRGKPLAGKRVGFGSYGSGASAAVFSGIIQERYREVTERMDIAAVLNKRRKISIQDYEALREGNIPFINPLCEHAGFVLEKIKEGVRTYKFNDIPSKIFVEGTP